MTLSTQNKQREIVYIIIVLLLHSQFFLYVYPWFKCILYYTRLNAVLSSPNLVIPTYTYSNIKQFRVLIHCTRAKTVTIGQLFYVYYIIIQLLSDIFCDIVIQTRRI